LIKFLRQAKMDEKELIKRIIKGEKDNLERKKINIKRWFIINPRIF